MADNDLNKANLVKFPTSANPDAQQPVEELNPQEAAVQVLKRLDTNRKKGIEILNKKCDAFDDRSMIGEGNPVTEDNVRDLEQAIKGTLLSVEALDSLLGMIRHDLISTIRNLEGQGAASFKVSAHLQTLIATLKEKGVVTEDELKETWDNTIVPQMKNQDGEG